MKQIIPFLFLLWLSQVFSKCTNETTEQPNLQIEVSKKSKKLIDADNKFGLELFQRVNQAEETENIMVSPLSISMALAMTYNGANGETKKAMAETLKLHGLSPEDINNSYQTLVAALASLDKKVILEIANSIFYREGFDVKKEFVIINQEYYDAEVSSLDFSSPTAVATINNWVADKTYDKITHIIHEISPAHVMFLLNAIYFKGIWQTEFNKKSTFKRSFQTETGEMQVDMMSKQDTLKYYSNELFRTIELPYGMGNYNMQIFLPQPDKKVENIIEKLDNDTWQNWMNNLDQEEQIDLQLPKFKFKYEIKLNDILSAMGMGVAFSDSADFSEMSETTPLKISYVKHKTFVEVNEEGTEAAAVTIVGIEKTSAGPPRQFIPFHVDRPFLFTITEKDTGAILFIAKVMKPEYVE